MTPPERAPAGRRAAALAVLVVLAGGCAASAPAPTLVDPIVLRDGGHDTPGGAGGADPVPLPDPEPAGSRTTSTATVDADERHDG